MPEPMVQLKGVRKCFGTLEVLGRETCLTRIAQAIDKL